MWGEIEDNSAIQLLRALDFLVLQLTGYFLVCFLSSTSILPSPVVTSSSLFCPRTTQLKIVTRKHPEKVKPADWSTQTWLLSPYTHHVKVSFTYFTDLPLKHDYSKQTFTILPQKRHYQTKTKWLPVSHKKTASDNKQMTLSLPQKDNKQTVTTLLQKDTIRQ